MLRLIAGMSIGTKAAIRPRSRALHAIHLAPPYTGGPAMSGGVGIPRDGIAVSVDWDDLRAQL
jgi:hypothetical protein